MLRLGAPVATDKTTVAMLGVEGNLKWSKGSGGGMDVMFPALPPNKMPCDWAWTLVLSNLG